jgi:NPCBM/NEW2 domain
MKTIASVTIALLIPFMVPPVKAEDWSLTTSDFHTQRINLAGLNADGVQIASANEAPAQVVPLDRFVSINRLNPSRLALSNMSLLLQGGDRLTGEPIKISGEDLIWKNRLLREIPIPLRRIVSLSRTGGPQPQPPPKQDTVSLRNGDVVTGVISDLTDEKLTIQTDNGGSDVPLASVKEIDFAAAGSSATGAGHGYRVQLDDGSTISVADAVESDEKLSLQFAGKTPLNLQVPIAHVTGIEQLNGPVSWLSSRTPSESLQIPYFGSEQSWPAMMDLTVDGLPIILAGERIDRGIGVHAYSRLTFPIESGWVAFRTQFAIDSRPESPRTLADVTVRILLDGHVAFEQPHVRCDSPAPVIQLDLKGAKTLTLEADYGDAGDTQAHLNWIEPALLRVAIPPTTEPASTEPASGQ